MEPVPETERMEEFRSSPVPSLRLQNPNTLSTLDIDNVLKKPPTLRRSTDPSPTSPVSPSWTSSTLLPYRPRTTSPLSGAHSRSRSTTSLAPPMSRTQSMPGVNGSGHILYSPQMMMRSASPSRSPARIRVPRKPVDEAFPPVSPVRSSVLDAGGHPEMRSTSPILGVSSSGSSSSSSSSGSTPNRLRRPSSPLRSVAHSSTGSLTNFPSTPSSSTSSYKSYDALAVGGYPAAASYSSVPSTPTSTRSRSPSISSLETIPDSPDAEEAALEADRIAQLKAAADAADSDAKGRSSLDGGQTRGRTLGFGSSRDKRKRWSVCGAERRGDLDLETIWED